jgi:hypothetical protein
VLVEGMKSRRESGVEGELNRIVKDLVTGEGDSRFQGIGMVRREDFTGLEFCYLEVICYRALVKRILTVAMRSVRLCV